MEELCPGRKQGQKLLQQIHLFLPVATLAFLRAAGSIHPKSVMVKRKKGNTLSQEQPVFLMQPHSL